MARMRCNSLMLFIALLIAAYLIGSVSSAIIVCRLLGVADPREVGSGNPGATNVLRHAGKKAAAVTLLGDAGKGVIPVLIAAALGYAPPQLTLIAFAAFAGHLYPLYYGFDGGKGVATFLGVNLALDWRLGATFVGVWLVVALVLRYSSLAALIATALIPVAAAWLGQPLVAVAVFVAMAVLIFWRHQGNIRNLLGGTEKRIGQKTSGPVS